MGRIGLSDRKIVILTLLHFLDDGLSIVRPTYIPLPQNTHLVHYIVTHVLPMVPEHKHMKIHEHMKLFLDFTHEYMNALQHS